MVTYFFIESLLFLFYLFIEWGFFPQTKDEKRRFNVGNKNKWLTESFLKGVYLKKIKLDELKDILSTKDEFFNVISMLR